MTVTLTVPQQEVVDFNDGALAVLAGPGSGKTRVLTERIRRLLGVPGEFFRVLALTFTNKAANEMKDRLADVPQIRERAFVGTLHSFCSDVLASRGRAVGVDAHPHIFSSTEDRKKILHEAIDGDPALAALLREAGDAQQQAKRLGEWLTLITKLKMRLQVPASVQDQNERHLYESYQAGLRACNALDFDDLLLLTYRLFEERPAIADFYQRQYRYICIDEAQDLNEAQYRVLRALCGQSYRNVMIVGDPRQAIFVFTGASPRYLDQFQADFGARQIVLDENFRSSRAVVAAARALNPQYQPVGSLPVAGELTTFVATDETAQASWIVDQIQTLLRDGHRDVEGPITLERCAVLGRNRYVFAALEDELTTRGIAFVKRTAAEDLGGESSLVAAWELCLRLIANPADRLHLRLLATQWSVATPLNDLLTPAPTTGLELVRRCVGGATAPVASAILRNLEAIDWATPGLRLERSLDALDQVAQAAADDERALVEADLRTWRTHWDIYVRSSSRRSIADFLSQVALGATQQARGEGLSLLSVHSAKGMEFDVVFIITLCEGVFPDYRAKGQQLEEEERSAFVAITRSRRLLYLSYPRTRTFPWGARIQTPSRFLREIQRPTAVSESQPDNGAQGDPRAPSRK